MHTLNRSLFACFGSAILIAGCSRAPSASPPNIVTSFCAGGGVDDRALQRVVGSIDDGNYFKSSAAEFRAKVKPELDRFGGAVGRWDDSTLNLPKMKELYAHNHTRLSGGVAVPDNGDARYRSRVVYLGLIGARGNSEAWATADSTDLEKVCT